MPVLHKLVAAMVFCAVFNASAFRTGPNFPSLQSQGQSLRTFANSATSMPRTQLLVMKKQLIEPAYSNRRMFGFETKVKPKVSLKNVVEGFVTAFHRFVQRAKEYLAQVERKDEVFVRKGAAAPDLTTTTFLSATSTPINKMLNVKSGREYAEAKLQEIDSYFKRVTQPLKVASSSLTSTDVNSANDAAVQKTKQQSVFDRKRSILDLADKELAGKRVLVRCDLDVPLQDGNITDDLLLQRSLATIQHLSGKGAKVVLAAHLGQPAGVGYEAQYSMDPVAQRLSALLGRAVILIPDCIGTSVGRGVAEMAPGDVVLLENLRFYAGEESNSAEFAKSLAAQVDVFVNDATDSVHRSLASNTGVAQTLPIAVAGLALKKELDFLQQAVHEPARPFVALVSGDELAAEVTFLEQLLHKADTVIVGGKMAAAFRLARGAASGTDGGAGAVAVAMDGEQVSAAQRLDKVAAIRSVPILLQSDENLQAAFANAKTVLWAALDASSLPADSEAVARAVATVTEHGGVSIVAGAVAAAAVESAGLVDNMSHISANSKTTFEVLKGNIMPAIAALNNF